MFRNLIFKLRFSVLSFLPMSWALVSCSVNSCLSSSDAPKRVDNCRLDNFLDLLAAGWSLSVGASSSFIRSRNDRTSLGQKKFPFETTYFSFGRLWCFSLYLSFRLFKLLSSVTNWEAGTEMSGKSALAFSLYPRLQCSAQIWPECQFIPVVWRILV